MDLPAIAQPRLPSRWVKAAAILLVLVGTVLIVLPLGSNTDSPPGRDAAHVLTFWAPGLLLIAIASVLYRGLLRPRTAVVLALALTGVWLMHPVCDPIDDADLPRFETVIALEQRARQGEPFRKLDGHWYQCKS